MMLMWHQLCTSSEKRVLNFGTLGGFSGKHDLIGRVVG